MNSPTGRNRSRLVWIPAGLCLLAGLACSGSPPQERVVARGPVPAVTERSDGLEYDPPAAGTYDLPAIQAAVDGPVVDADGTKRNLFDYMGDRHVFLSLMYTSCTDGKGCPLARGVFHMMEGEIEAEPELAENVRLVTLSFDPERDTPEVMRKYAAQDYVETMWKERPWVFLTTTSPAEIQPILDGYGQYVVPEYDESGEPTGDLSHVLKVFLIDRQRRVRNIYSSSFIHPTIAINDLRTLLMEDAGSN